MKKILLLAIAGIILLACNRNAVDSEIKTSTQGVEKKPQEVIVKQKPKEIFPIDLLPESIWDEIEEKKQHNEDKNACMSAFEPFPGSFEKNGEINGILYLDNGTILPIIKGSIVEYIDGCFIQKFVQIDDTLPLNGKVKVWIDTATIPVRNGHFFSNLEGYGINDIWDDLKFDERSGKLISGMVYKNGYSFPMVNGNIIDTIDGQRIFGWDDWDGTTINENGELSGFGNVCVDPVDDTGENGIWLPLWKNKILKEFRGQKIIGSHHIGSFKGKMCGIIVTRESGKNFTSSVVGEYVIEKKRVYDDYF
ncbi:MAG TPA: hypothetical protein VIH31_01715 [Candidatus Paceibacterota bacterium]